MMGDNWHSGPLSANTDPVTEDCRADLPVRVHHLRRAPRGRPGLHRRRPHRLPGVRHRSAAQGVRVSGRGVQGLRLLPQRQPSRRRLRIRRLVVRQLRDRQLLGWQFLRDVGLRLRLVVVELRLGFLRVVRALHHQRSCPLSSRTRSARALLDLTLIHGPRGLWMSRVPPGSARLPWGNDPSPRLSSSPSIDLHAAHHHPSASAPPAPARRAGGRVGRLRHHLHPEA